MVDHIISQEDQAFAALVSSIQNQSQRDDHDMSTYESDDEEYDKLFIEVMSAQEATGENTEGGGKTDLGGDKAMDVSLG